MIEINNLTKTYDKSSRALKGVDISIEDGEFVFITGRSGSGKSTLLRILLKEVEPTSGRVVVNDMDLGAMPRRYVPRYRRTLGVVFQDFRLLKDRTVYENIAFAQRVIGVPGRNIKEAVPRMLKLVGLSSKYKAFPHQLSGGEQQRVAIARALASDARVILADEPTGNLDSENTLVVVELLRKLAHEQGYCVITVTHDLAIADLADEVLRLKDGALVSDGE